MNCFQLIAELITGKYASMKWQTRDISRGAGKTIEKPQYLCMLWVRM